MTRSVTKLPGAAQRPIVDTLPEIQGCQCEKTQRKAARLARIQSVDGVKPSQAISAECI